MAGTASGEAARGRVPGVHHVHGDDAARDVEAAGEFPDRGDPVAPVPDPGLAERRPEARQPAPVNRDTSMNVSARKAGAAVRGLDVGGQPAQARHPGRRARHPSGSGMTKRELLQTRCRRRNRRSGVHPVQRSRAAGLDAPGCRPPGASQVPPCSATRAAGPCRRCRGTAGSDAPRPGGPGAGARRGSGAP